MSDDSLGTEQSGVSPARKAISACVLVVLLIVLGIEMRAGVGHYLTGQAFAAAAPEGVFIDTTVDQVEEMTRFGPSRSIVRERGNEVEYCYRWFSLLRPILARPAAEYYVAADKGEKNLAFRFSEIPPEMPPEEVRTRDSQGEPGEDSGPEPPAGPEPTESE